jgi:hypothetical protein
VAQTTLLTDDLLRHLMAVGQVDIVVGVPTLNNADTIGGTLKAADQGLARYFPRERTVIINADGGSRDGTSEIVTEVASGVGGRRDTWGALRTRHQISTSYRGVPGKAGTVRLIFAAADLLQAGAVAVLDPEVTSVTPAWIATLVGPVWKQSFDLVAPLYGRHPLEGVMLTQLVGPLMRATYGRQVDGSIAYRPGAAAPVSGTNRLVPAATRRFSGDGGRSRPRAPVSRAVPLRVR